MTFMSPLALLGLASVPVLVWLWRFAASHARTVIPSLVPFEHLLRRPLTRRTRLIVNALFWLQLAALVLLVLALADPVIPAQRSKTVLVVLDTSASMAASLHGESAFERAKGALLKRVAAATATRFFVVTTAPVNRLTPEPTSDAPLLRQLVEATTVSDLAGNLSTAYRIGRMLLGTPADEVLVLTDEPMPPSLGHAGSSSGAVSFQSFGEPLPNVAIVGIDAREPLCQPSASRQPVVWVQNFAATAQTVTLTLSRDHQRITATSVHLEPGSRMPVALPIPEATPPDASARASSGGDAEEVIVKAEQDALAVDNRAWLMVHGSETFPVAVAGEPAFVETIGRWLDACQHVVWSSIALEDSSKTSMLSHGALAEVLVTDQLRAADSWPAAVMAFTPVTTERRVTLSQWLVDGSHPIGEYLNPLETVPTVASPAGEESRWGDPVVWGVAHGRRLPLVTASASSGRRLVQLFFDPTASRSSVPPVIVFFNSLRWLVTSHDVAASGEALIVSGLGAGVVRVSRPRGAPELLNHAGGLLRYASTDQAGRYRFAQGATVVERVANFLDPVESNTMQRASTWGTEPVATVSSAARERSRQSLLPWLIGALIVLLLAEWWLYSWRGYRKQRAVTNVTGLSS